MLKSFLRRRAPIGPVGSLNAGRAGAMTADPLSASQVLAVDTKIGRLLVHADDDVMTPFIVGHREWEPAEAAWIERALAPGATMLDVGANLGYFARFAAQLVGPGGSVIAVEPERRNLQLLRHNTWEFDNVEILPVAAWDTRTSLELRHHPSNFGDHQVHRAGERGAGVLIPALPLDEVLGDRRIDVIKIDTQGADHYVVSGLAEVFGANPGLTALVEFWLESMEERGDEAATVLAGYRDLGRPIGLLQDDGTANFTDDSAILAAAADAPARFVNLVIGAS